MAQKRWQNVDLSEDAERKCWRMTDRLLCLLIGAVVAGILRLRARREHSESASREVAALFWHVFDVAATACMPGMAGNSRCCPQLSDVAVTRLRIGNSVMRNFKKRERRFRPSLTFRVEIAGPTCCRVLGRRLAVEDSGD